MGGPESPGGELESWGWEGGRSAGTPEPLRAGAADLEPKRGARTPSHQGAQLPAGAPTRANPALPQRPSPPLHSPGAARTPSSVSRAAGAPLASRGQGLWAHGLSAVPAEGRARRARGWVRLRGLCPPFSVPLPALSGAGEGGKEVRSRFSSGTGKVPEMPRRAPLLRPARCPDSGLGISVTRRSGDHNWGTRGPKSCPGEGGTV